MRTLLAVSPTTDSSDYQILEDATERVSALTKFWNEINWDAILATVLSKLIVLALVTVFLVIIRKIGNDLIKRTFQNYKKKESYSENRIETLYTLTSNSFLYLLYFIFLYTVLTLLGVPVGSLVAGAGIAGIAIGLGAQGFINDFLTGFFIILERQLDIGNHVKIDDIEGTVVAIGLRTTQIKGFNGTLHYIPNRYITIISNLSRENMLALITLRITPEADVAKIATIIAAVNKKLVPQHPEIQQGPTNLGVVDLGNGNLAIKITILTRNGSQLQVQADFLEHYLAALKAAGIELPQAPLIINP